MTPEKQRIEIVKACGWRFGILSHGNPRIEGWFDSDGQFRGEGTECLPDYLNDLNAMHEAVMTLTGEDRSRYYDELERVLFGQSEIHWSEDKFHMINAKAEHMAEAFLKTLGLWEE